MNRGMVVFCTPDIFRPGARRALETIKNTNLSDVELVVADNCYDEKFRHPNMMQRYLDYAAGGLVVFLDDDVLVCDPNWFAKLKQCAEVSGSTVVGCIHTYSNGEVNHTGIMAYADGTTEMMNEESEPKMGYRFVPGLSSAVMMITDSRRVSFDVRFQKYHHDSDVCISAWEKGLKVACCDNLAVIHQIGGYMTTKERFRNIWEEDALILKKKWKSFLNARAYDIPELSGFKKIAAEFNWETLYNKASRMSESSPEEALQIFLQIANSCPFLKRRAGALYHMYMIDKDPEHLHKCLQLNSRHMTARKILNERELGDGSV